MTAVVSSLGRAPVASKTTSAVKFISVLSCNTTLTFSASISSAVPASTVIPWLSNRS